MNDAVAPLTVVPFHERLPELEKDLAERGSLGVVVLDATPLGEVEDQYGTEALEEVRQRVFKLFAEQRGKEFRTGDILCMEKPRGLRFLFFLERKRRRSVPFSFADLRAVRARMLASLMPNVARASFPYFKTAPRLEVGYGVAVFNPLLHPERIVQRAIQEALDFAAHQRKADEILVLEGLQDILLRERIITAFQPIKRLKEETVMGFEALSRGPRGSGLEGADALFQAATDHNLLIELDRLCRRRALLSSGRIPSTAKIFVNTLPATMRDPQFRGKALIDFLDKAQVSPARIVIEITEKEVIENYEMFRDTMTHFSQLGMSFAVDDVGAGHSGLETIEKLKPSFLKIDISLVRDVHVFPARQAMVNFLISLGRKIGAQVIAEGIQTEEETQALKAMGVDYGQGHYLARPDAPPE
jgi:EAL domain-containing protein (putative c-di-GMP-specific phosphodiesterase class I)